ncbi:hypothetical protein MNBD_GAMMA05-2516 [hydrothermal vent metagenome]|uniref:FecR protein domain-containing protein n=1 Tax=hydrothermal vent metagenome TaxID=652676 RepID=A0A3B0XHP0_9ZZZZ
MFNIKIITFMMCLFVSLQSFASMADQEKYRGKILKFSGDVEVVNAKGETRVVKQVDEPLNEMDTIVTKKGARIVVQLDDGALSVLDEKSRLRVEKTSWFSYLGGKVYFTFKKVFGDPRRIKTRAATIGVRGTTFIISENEKGESVALKEGLLEVESNGPVFEIHKKKIMDEFSQFKQQYQQAQQDIKNEFEQYKQQTTNEFIEYRKKFTLSSNRVISLSGYRVDETGVSNADKADFESFESEADELIKQFRAKSKALIAK